MLTGGGNFAWAETVTVGTEDNSAAFWSVFSDYYTIQPNRSLRLSFTNYSDKAENCHNWVAAITTDADRAATGYTEYLILRTDNYGWGDSYSAGTLTNNYNWDTFKADMDNSHVEMTVSRSGATVTVRADITTSTGTQYYEQWVGTCGDGTQNIRVFLTTEAGHLTDINMLSADSNIYYFFQDYEDATDASSWTLPVGANNTLSLITGDANHGKYIKHDTGDRSRNVYTVFSSTDFYEDDAYTAEFDCAFRAGNRNDKVELTVNPWGANANTNTPYLFNMIEDNGITMNADLPFNINGATEEVKFTAKTWYHVKLDITSTTVGYTISNASGAALTNGTGSYTIPDGQSYKAKGITITTGRNYGESWMDNIKIYGEGTERIINSVSTSSLNLATGKATIAISAETNAVSSTLKHYYSTSYKLTSPVEIVNGSVELTSGTYYFYTVNTATGSQSNSLQYVVDASEKITAPTVTVNGGIVTIASGTSNATANVSSYAVKFATSNNPATEGTALTEGSNTLEQGYYYIYTVSEYGNASAPTYAEIVTRATETFDFKTLYNNGSGYTNLNNSGTGTNGYDISTLSNSSGEVGRYINGRLQFWYQAGNGNNWWFRSSYGQNTLFVSANKSSNFAVKVSAGDAVAFTGLNLEFIDDSNVYGVSSGDAVVNGKLYFAKTDGYVVIKGVAYAQMSKVVVNTNDEIFTNISASKAISGPDRVITLTPAYSTSDEVVNTYYTTDGSTPTTASMLVEGNTITVSKDCTLKIASINTVTGNFSNVFSTDVVCGTVNVTYNFSFAALTEAYGGTTISFDTNETSVAKFSNVNYYQAYCGDGETKTAIENFAISKNGQLAYNATKDGLYNSGGGYRGFAILNAKAGQKILFNTEAGSETDEISVISNASSMALGTGSGSWAFTVNNNGTVAFNTHRYSYIKSISICDPTSISVTVANTYATYANHSYALDFTGIDGLTAFTATLNNERDAVVFTPATQVPAGTGLLLMGETKNVPVIATADAIEDNLMFAPTTAITSNSLEFDDGTYQNYILTKPEGKSVGFYRANKNNVAVGKAYLRIPKATEARQFTFIGFDGNSETTGISEKGMVNSDIFATVPAYNLQGQRVNTPAKGLYIVNGKKVVINK